MPQLHTKDSQESPREKRVLVLFIICALLITVTWTVFAQTLKHDFVNYDDDGYVLESWQRFHGITFSGVWWAFTHTYVGNWQPLTAISHMLDCQFFGVRPGGHHFTNTALHSVAAVLLFLVFRTMTNAVWRSAFVAALFAIHPLHVESVAWISERKDILSAVFFVLTLGAYVRYVRAPSLARYVAMSILFALGLMTKPMLVTVPFVLLLLDYWPLQRMGDLPSLRRLVVEKIPLFIMSAVSAVATVIAQDKTIRSLEHLPLSWRIENAFVSIFIYLRETFWPADLAVFYPHPRERLSFWMVAFAIILVVGVSFVVVALRRRGYVPAGWFWYLGMLVPVIGIVQVGLQSHADRYTYLPNIGLYLLLTWGIVDLTARWRFQRQVLAVGSIAAIASLMYCAHIQASYWRNSETLWRHTLAVTENNDIAHTNLGNLLRAQEAIPHYEKALEIAPHTVLPLNNLAWIFATAPNAELRDSVRAVELAKEADQLSGGNDPVIVRTLAAAYAESGRFSEATETALRALTLAIAQDNAALAADLRANIDNYQKQIPLRDPSLNQ